MNAKDMMNILETPTLTLIQSEIEEMKHDLKYGEPREDVFRYCIQLAEAPDTTRADFHDLVIFLREYFQNKLCGEFESRGKMYTMIEARCNNSSYLYTAGHRFTRIQDLQHC